MPLMPSLMVPGNAEEMAHYYADVFPDGSITNEMKMPGPDGGENYVLANVQLNGTDIMLLNGTMDHDTTFTEAFSFTINCKDQKEVDYFWDRFVGDGGAEVACGWCKDKFGFFWQVIPEEMPACLNDPDPERAGKAFAAMQEMIKIDIDAIKAAMNS